MNSINGYILKFYKKITALKNGNDDFHFVSFMNFDGVKIIPIEKFSDYQKRTIKFSEPEDYDINCSRQKLLIYNFNKNFSNLKSGEDIFDHTKSSFSSQYPILAVTIVNLKRTAKQKDVIAEAKNVLDKQNVKYKFFGSLSINDFVIVFRCKSFSDLFDCNVYSLFKKSQSLHSTYTIPCLLLSCAESWKEKNGLEISIRSSTLPQDSYYNKQQNSEININGKNVKGLNVVTKYNVFGKYDIDIRGTIESSSEFLKNFSEGLFFENKNDENTLLRHTNTRFLHKCKDGNTETITYQPDKINTSIIDFQKTVSQLSSKTISESQSNTADYNQNLARLWLRAYQLLIRSRDNPVLDDISKVVEEYFHLANIYVNNIEYSDSIILGLKSLNTLIDNRDLNDFYEFENPHSNLMFSGCSTALLSTYSNMARKAFEFIKQENSEEKCYYPYITSDGYAEVSAKELFQGNEECFLVNIRIPTELTFDFKNLVCFILHEIGHYWDFIAYDSDCLLDFYLDLSLKQHLITSQDEKNVYTLDEVSAIKNFALNLSTDKSSFEIFKCLSLSFNKKQSNRNMFDIFQITSNIMEDIISFDNALLEAVSDIFMIKFIGIKSVEFYLNVVFDYLRYKNIAFVSSESEGHHYLSNFFLRVTIVLLFLLSEDLSSPDKTFNLLIDEMRKYAEGQSGNSKVAECKKEFINQLISFLSINNSYSIAFHYAHELYTGVIVTGDSTPNKFREKFDFSNNKDIALIQNKFEKYLNSKNDTERFNAIIDFIKTIN